MCDACAVIDYIYCKQLEWPCDGSSRSPTLTSSDLLKLLDNPSISMGGNSSSEEVRDWSDPDDEPEP